MDSLAANLARSPELLPFALDPMTDQVTLIRMTEADYRHASFLDARILTVQTLRRTVSWEQLETAVAGSNLNETANYIFHIGHVGSTLLSRLLGSHPQVFALREPAILRTLAVAPPRPHSPDPLDTVLRLLSRTFRPEQCALIKTTSFVSELADQIMARLSQPRAIFLFVTAETYLASILGAPNSPKEARFLAESRLRRLHRRIGGERWRLAELSEGDLVAMSWACEMTALAAAAEAAGDRARWLNFDDFLQAPTRVLTAAFRHFGIETTQAGIAEILSGPDMGRYAKAPEHAYDANLRAAVLNQARHNHAREIRRGLSWLRSASDVSAVRGGCEIAGSR